MVGARRPPVGPSLGAAAILAAPTPRLAAESRRAREFLRRHATCRPWGRSAGEPCARGRAARNAARAPAVARAFGRGEGGWESGAWRGRSEYGSRQPQRRGWDGGGGERGGVEPDEEAACGLRVGVPVRARVSRVCPLLCHRLCGAIKGVGGRRRPGSRLAAGLEAKAGESECRDGRAVAGRGGERLGGEAGSVRGEGGGARRNWCVRRSGGKAGRAEGKERGKGTRARGGAGRRRSGDGRGGAGRGDEWGGAGRGNGRGGAVFGER